MLQLHLTMPALRVWAAIERFLIVRLGACRIRYGAEGSRSTGLLSTKQGDRWQHIQNRNKFCLWATLSRDAKFGPVACSLGSRKPILSAQLDVTLARFDIGRKREQPADQCRLYAQQHRTGA